MATATILSVGKHLPEKRVGNADLTQFPANARDLVAQKTGILERRHAAEDEMTSDLGYKAAVDCLARGEVDPGEVDALILATSSPDGMQPATACRIQEKLGLSRAYAFDVNSVCSGSIVAISLASALIRSGAHRHVLVVAAENYSKILNPKDFSTYPYFGDGAGAILFGSSEDEGRGVLCSRIHTDGSGADVIRVEYGGVGYRANPTDRGYYFAMDGRKVFDFAVQRGSEVIRELLDSRDLGLDDVRLIFPHQANVNVIQTIAGRLGVGMDKFFVNLQKLGNTASASVPLALEEAWAGGLVARGDAVVTVGFGGGLTWGANLIVL